jgi:hypothetical protein
MVVSIITTASGERPPAHCRSARRPEHGTGENSGVGQARIEDYQEAFARIERRVDAGDTDLAHLGFWRLVGRLKLEPRLAEHWAEDVGRIDRKAFERRVRIRMPVWLGNAILVVASAAAVALVRIALALARDDPESTVAGILALVAAGWLSATLHVPAHWAVGRLVGIRFTHAFVGGPLRVTPGVKIDYASYLRASPGARAWMHAAGAVASKIAPFAVFAAVYLPHRAAGYDLLPSWSLWTILALGVLQLVTDATFSVRRSDWKKVLRERRLARRHRSPVP